MLFEMEYSTPKHTLSAEVDSKKYAKNIFQRSNQRHQAVIEYADKDSEEWRIRENNIKYFQVLSEQISKEKELEYNTSLSRNKKNADAHYRHGRESHGAGKGLIHSRESYVHNYLKFMSKGPSKKNRFATYDQDSNDSRNRSSHLKKGANGDRGRHRTPNRQAGKTKTERYKDHNHGGRSKHGDSSVETKNKSLNNTVVRVKMSEKNKQKYLQLKSTRMYSDSTELTTSGMDAHKMHLRDRNKHRYKGSDNDRYKEKRKDDTTERYHFKKRSKHYIEKKGKKAIATKSYHAVAENPTVNKNKPTTEKSYESIEVISEEDISDFKEKSQSLRLPGPKKSALKFDAIEDIEELAPHSIAKQLSYLKSDLSKEANIEQEIIGRTVEYNDIVLWKIKQNSHFKSQSHSNSNYSFRAIDKKKYDDEPPEKKIIFITHGLTVMGWSELDCLSKVNRFKTLVGYYLENLDSFDIFLIPMANPDGVAKITALRLPDSPVWWNKNVSPQNTCPGVNLDRNFDVGWNATNEKSISSCSQNYPGTRPFSEHESDAVRDVFLKYGHKMVAYFHVHAGTYDDSVFKGDAVLYPRGFSAQQIDDDKYIDLKGQIDEAMRNTSFKVLTVSVDTLYNWYLGPIVGSSVDYASTVYGIPYALEFVMQIYKENLSTHNVHEDQQVKHIALTEVWQVLIDEVFDAIYKSVVKPNERRWNA